MSGNISDPINWFNFAHQNWHHPIALFAAIISVLIINTGILYLLGLSTAISIIIYVILIVATVIIWLWSNRLPKASKGKIGFVIGLRCDQDEERKKVKEDFLITLHELMKQGQSGKAFQMIILPDHVADKIIDEEAARKIRTRCKSLFVLYGRVRLRKIGQHQNHILHLEGLVGHREVSETISKSISKEFAELWPRKIRIQTENDVVTLSFTSEWIECVAKYIIGIAAFCSGDLDFSEKMQKDTQISLMSKDGTFPVFAKLKKKVTFRLAEINFVKTHIAYCKWVETHEQDYVDKMGTFLNRVPKQHANDYSISILRSIYFFINKRDIKAAMRELINSKSRSEGNATWRFNLAFLQAYSGNLIGAFRLYRASLKGDFENKTIIEIEEFITWILQEEPDKNKLYACLGYINWQFKDDLSQALKDFEKYLELEIDEKPSKAKVLVIKWVEELRNLIK